MSGYAFNGLCFHAKDKAQCDKGFSGDMVRNEFIFWFNHGFYLTANILLNSDLFGHFYGFTTILDIT